MVSMKTSVVDDVMWHAVSNIVTTGFARTRFYYNYILSVSMWVDIGGQILKTPSLDRELDHVLFETVSIQVPRWLLAVQLYDLHYPKKTPKMYYRLHSILRL